MPLLSEEEARHRFGAARVARLATADERGRPHLVPVTFALLGGDRIVTAVDHKPKRTAALKRLANIAANPLVSLLVDHYEEEWTALWWARADGRARVLAAGERDSYRSALAALSVRYAQYLATPPIGPVILIDVERWSGWEAAGPGDPPGAIMYR